MRWKTLELRERIILFLERHPARWVYIKKITCALNSMYREKYSYSRIAHHLIDLYPILEKEVVGKRIKYRLNEINRPE